MDQKMLGTIAMYAVPVAIAAMLGYHFLMPHGAAPAKAKAPVMAFAAPHPERSKPAALVMNPYGGVPAQTPAVDAGMGAVPAAGVPLGQGLASGTGTADASGTADVSGTSAAAVTAADLSVLNGDMHTLSTQLDNIEAQLAGMRAIQQRAARSLRLRQSATRLRDVPAPGKARDVKADIAGYHLQAVGQTEAWLTDPDGNTVIVMAGQTLRGGLRIEAVAPDGVVTNRGMLGF